MKKKIHLVLFMSILMAMCTAMLVSAEEREKINKVNLSIKSHITTGYYNTEVDITADSSDKYTVDGYELINENGDQWSQYSTPRIKIILTAEDGYYFKSQSKSSISLKGSDVFQFVDAERQDDGTYLEIVVDLRPVGGKLGNPAEAEWTKNCRAQWSKGYKADEYEVDLYADDDRIRSVTTSSTSYDFSADMGEGYDYHFRVRSSKKESSKSTLKSDWVKSDFYDAYELTTTKKVTGQTGSNSNSVPGTSEQGSWYQNATGWWYRNGDGSWPASTWSYINGQWYYFGGDGYMKTGWQDVGGRWYCLSESGVMYADIRTPDGYQVGSDGAWIQ